MEMMHVPPEEKARQMRVPLGGAPETPAVESDLAAACGDDARELTPKQTADCAGLEMTERYENEEDGGS